MVALGNQFISFFSEGYSVHSCLLDDLYKQTSGLKVSKKFKLLRSIIILCKVGYQFNMIYVQSN
jgi:hypothetical protein